MNHVTADFIKQALEITNGLEVQTTKNCIYMDNFFKNFSVFQQLSDMQCFAPFNPDGALAHETWKRRDVLDYRAVLHIKTQPEFSFKIQRIIYDAFGVRTDPCENAFWTNLKWRHQMDYPIVGELPHKDPNEFVVVAHLSEPGATYVAEDNRGWDHEDAFALVTGGNMTPEHTSKWFTLTDVVPAKLNRMTIFDGNKIHGALFTDKEFVNEWRKIAVFFFRKCKQQ